MTRGAPCTQLTGCRLARAARLWPESWNDSSKAQSTASLAPALALPASLAEGGGITHSGLSAVRGSGLQAGGSGGKMAGEWPVLLPALAAGMRWGWGQELPEKVETNIQTD